jgi:hypothetical protein
MYNECYSHLAKRPNCFLVISTGDFLTVTASATQLDPQDQSSRRRQVPQPHFPRISLGSRLRFEQLENGGETIDQSNTPKLTNTLEKIIFDIHRCMQLTDPISLKNGGQFMYRCRVLDIGFARLIALLMVNTSISTRPLPK